MKTAFKRIHGKEARKKMMEGVDLLADVVGSTMGAKGRNVVIDEKGEVPMVINDGVTVAENIEFKDDLQNMAAKLIKDAARKTNMLAGDGTTSSIVLARAILKKGWELVEKGVNPVQLRKELERECEFVLAEAEKTVKKVETKQEAINIAKVSVQDEELGNKIGELMFDLGANGAVAFKPSIEKGVFFEKDAGMRMEGALAGGVLDNQDKWESKLDKPMVLILKDSPEDHEFESKWIPLMKQFADGKVDASGNMTITKVNVPSLLVVAEKLSRRFLMAMNSNKEVVKWVWFRPTTAMKNMKEIYEDLRCMVGGQIVHEENGIFLAKMSLSDFGKAETATINRHEMVLTVNKESLNCDRFLDRVQAVKGQMTNAEDLNEREQIRERYANLTGGVATIRFAGATDQESRELFLRIEDAVNATRSGMQDGYVAGGGVALMNASKSGGAILSLACHAPLVQILHNAGWDSEKIDKELKKFKDGEGVDVLTDQVVNMVEVGVVDPWKVVKLSLQHAVSVAGLLLTSEFAITDEDDELETLKKILKGR